MVDVMQDSIQVLLDHPKGQGMIVSCYADTSMTSGFQWLWSQHLKKEASAIEQRLKDDPRARARFARDLQVIQHALAEPSVQPARGMAVFSAADSRSTACRSSSTRRRIGARIARPRAGPSNGSSRCMLTVRSTSVLAVSPKASTGRARLGEASTVPGIQASYEAPDHADVIVFGHRESPQSAAHTIVRALEDRGYVTRQSLGATP